MSFLRFLFSLVVIAALAIGVLVYIGWYEVAADKPHTEAVAWFADHVRDRSVEVRARGVQVPRLDDEAMVREGAEHYGAMCAGCHMAPGATDTSFPDALYPHPPRLTEKSDLTPAQQFWIIKHGIKLSAMPAWGGIHDDRSLWNIVAFLQRLPELSRDQYQAMLPAPGSGGEHEHAEAPVQEPVPPGAAHEHGASPGDAHEQGGATPGDAHEHDETAPKRKPEDKKKTDEPEQHETRP